ncbi:Pathogenesis-related protein R major form [Morella rubra]|uniref:Pathogenesis-related protein R major form n=1 Tax=Morella rubra TaxID=262757 RepID=A0A6A1VYC7_9ROSI|nr:Pathogenesis-related protein R major form [Morella rubra]
MRSLAILLLSIQLLFIVSSHAAIFEIRNECPYTVWAAASPGGGRRLDRGQSWTINVAPGTAMARIWGRTNCNFDGSGRGHCQTGDCGGVLDCKRAPGGCNNPCTVFKTNQYCCTNGQGSCGPTNFSKFFKSRCPDAYSYPQDDPTSTFTCPGGTNYRVVFCPVRSPHFPLEMVGGTSEE